ncbi:MAG: protein kinase [Acidobacteria bacterium]|nr:protein kinase [Acidobacteriota bacterium]
MIAPGTRLGSYEILAPLGAGGMGVVYKARDPKLGRDVAIKMLPEDLAGDRERLKRFEQEARAAGALNHPNILGVHELGRHGDSPYLVMELLEGESLRSVMSQGPLRAEKVAELGEQVALGLAAAHERGIVHRDLKPENLFLTRDGVVKILDFGLAKRSHVEEVGSRHALDASTASGVVMGTVSYMSPEQATNRPVDFPSDQFSLGVVLYEALSGRRPFSGDSAAEILAAIVRDEPVDLQDLGLGVSPSLAAIVKRCLAKEPQDRYPATRELARRLEIARLHAHSGGTESTGMQPVKMPAVNGGRRMGRPALAGISLAALTVFGVLVAIIQKVSAASTAVPSVLALPCTVYGAPEAAFLADAVPGTLSTLLAQVEGMDMKVPPNSLEVEKVKGDLTKLASLYQVSSFIVTSITSSPGRFALNVQLIDAKTKKVLWGNQFEGPREMYNDLARQAAEGIRLTVRPSALPVRMPEASSEAELALRQGKFYSERYQLHHRPDDFDAALKMFSRASEIAPSLASAPARMAILFIYRFDFEADVRGSRKEAESWARRAIGIDPRCGEAWAALSQVELFSPQANPGRGIDYAVKAVAFSPREAWTHANLGMWLSGPGTISLFVAGNLRSVELDPIRTAPAANASSGLSLLGRPEDALVVIDRALKNVEEFPWGLSARAFALLKLGRLEEAERDLRRSEPLALKTHTQGELWRQIRFAVAVGQRDTAATETMGRQVLASVLDPRADANMVNNAVMFAAPAFVRAGKGPEALRILEKSLEVGAPPAYDWLLAEPEFQILRGDPRFAKVLAGARDGAGMVARALGQARDRGELPTYLEKPLEDLVKVLDR